ncbi:hypothetical protein ACFQ7F_41880 [Streptomyces sp. NPDC056486]|uniref:hypothetical protein n=1 Tax=Streptomyces sp. NPDC056486 TaxID=3345835 RepID=UPI003695E5BF
METSSSSAEETRAGWSAVLELVRLTGAHHVITRHGRAAAVLVPSDWHAKAGGKLDDTITAQVAARGLGMLVDRAQAGQHVAVTYRGGAGAVAVPPEWHTQVVAPRPE